MSASIAARMLQLMGLPTLLHQPRVLIRKLSLMTFNDQKLKSKDTLGNIPIA